MANRAQFTINGTPAIDANGKRGYDATAGEELAITLEANPAIGVLTVTYELYDATKPFGATPLNSLFDSDQNFDETGTKVITTSDRNATFHITINPATEISSYVLRSTVVTASGAHVFERMIAIRKNGLRMTVPSESTQYGQRGWSDALNELTKVVADNAANTVLVDSANTGIVAAFPSGQRRIFHSDGSTAGGTWSQLSATDITTAIADGAIAVDKLTAGSDGQVLRTSGGVVVWGTDTTLTPPADPGEDGYVAVGASGDLVYTLINDVHIASGANIAVSKLAAGSEGYALKIVSGTPTWAEDSQLNAPVNPGDNGRVAIASGGDLVYGLISDTQVDASAAIAVSKLASGTEGYVLKIVSGTPTWAVEGGGGISLPATPGDDNKIAFASGGNLAYADGVLMLNSGGNQNGISLTGLILSDTGGSLAATAVGNEASLHNEGSTGNPLWTWNGTTHDLLRGNQPIASDLNKVMTVDGNGFINANLIVNDNVDSNANIGVDKLQAGTDYYVLRSLSSSVSWALITNDSIAASADIDPSKIASGTSGQYLRTEGGIATWSSTLDGTLLSSDSVNVTKIANGPNNWVMVTSASGNVVWDLLNNINIDSNANIAVTKLAMGASNSVLASNGSSNFWDTTPTVSTITGTTSLITQGYAEFQATISEPASAPPQGVRLFVYDGGVFAAKFDDSTVWELCSEII